jgi:hypothetical protein
MRSNKALMTREQRRELIARAYRDAAKADAEGTPLPIVRLRREKLAKEAAEKSPSPAPEDAI